MKAVLQQQGLTLIEMLLALALTAVLGVMLATQMDVWVGLRQDRSSADSPDAQVLELCELLEQRFAGLIERPLQAHGLPVYNAPLDWQPDRRRLEWVALAGPGLAGLVEDQDRIPGHRFSSVQRQALVWERARLRLEVSDDLDSVQAPVWRQLKAYEQVSDVSLTFRAAGTWQGFPSARPEDNEAVRLQFNMAAALEGAYQCTFVLPGIERRD